MRHPWKRRWILTLCSAVTLAGSAMAAPSDHWTDFGSDLPGTHGSPALEGVGLMVPGSKVELVMTNALAQTTGFLIAGLVPIFAPFEGGFMVPRPDVIIPISTGGAPGTPTSVTVSGILPKPLDSHTDLYFQFWVIDPGGPQGFAASNAVRGRSRQVHDAISDELDEMIGAAGGPAVAKPIYTTQDFGNLTFERNDDCWAADLDLTGLSPWNQTGGRTRAGTLVSPRHIVFAEHYRLSTSPGNNELVFVTEDDQTITRKLIATEYPWGDIGVGVLDEDVPAEIGFHKVLPRTWADCILSVDRLPMLHLDQEEFALVRDMRTLGGVCTHGIPTDSRRLDFYEVLIGGDSGNPAFLIINQEAILILTHFSAVHGPFYTAHFDVVNQAMSNLGGGYQLTEFDLDGWLTQ